MDLANYRKFLENLKLPEEKVLQAVDTIDRFVQFYSTRGKSLDTLTTDDVHAFGEDLITAGQNDHNRFAFLYYYGVFLKNDVLIVGSMETLDGEEMFPNLSKQLIEHYGQDFRDEIFEDIPEFPLGLYPKKKPAILKQVVSRIINRLGNEKSIAFFKPGLRDPYPQSYVKAKEDFDKLNNLDEFLKLKHQSLVETLEKHFNEGTLFFTQKVDQSSLDFVKSDQRISAGIREGNKIMMYKIPYMTVEALKATNPRERNYYVCHNPLIREALLKEDQPVNPIFCNCSGGFIKNFWEAMFEESVEVEFLSSVMTGDQFCRFAVHIPEKIMQSQNLQ
jgi:hypothetical protein